MTDKKEKRDRIQPRTLRGFRDYLPDAMLARERLIDIARGVYRRFGFAPIDTPALEYLEILAGKGGDETDKQMYRFEDNGGRSVGMRFDLTVPLARFAAQHIGALGTPFKRYHIATVWRGENTQRGRYREFMQCDFDTIGTRSITADVETVMVVHDLMRAIGFDAFTISVNNRKLLSGLLERLDIADQSAGVLRSLDKLAKIGREKVAAEMVSAAGISTSAADEVLKLADITGDAESVLEQAASLVAGNETGMQGLAELGDVWRLATAAGVAPARLKLDIAIARGLDYYTGTVLETVLDDLPTIGSVCSGGRYDNLADLYTKQELPGIGASLGLDRLLAAMEELNMNPSVTTPAEVFVVYFDGERLEDYLRLAQAIRATGIGCEVYPEPKKLKTQLEYANRRGHRVALIAGSREFEAGICQVKDLSQREATDASLADDAAEVVTAVRKILAAE